MVWNTQKEQAMTQYKILVVDDEENIRTLVQTMVKGEGRHVVWQPGEKMPSRCFKRSALI